MSYISSLLKSSGSWYRWLGFGIITQRNFFSWFNCLDESIYIWSNKSTCLGWVLCLRKPHPFGNKYHSICCGLSEIMFYIGLVEGKYHSGDTPPNKYNMIGKTAVLRVRICRHIYSTGNVVILYSCFCVLQESVELRKFIFQVLLSKIYFIAHPVLWWCHWISLLHQGRGFIDGNYLEITLFLPWY